MKNATKHADALKSLYRRLMRDHKPEPKQPQDALRALVSAAMSFDVPDSKAADAMSLKDKRRVIKSIKDRIANSNNVSIAEVGALDEHRRCILGMAMVSNDSRYVEGALSKLVDFVRMVPQVSLIDYQIELL